MPQPTPVFTATSKRGIEALASAEAAGKALEAVGRRTRFAFGLVLGSFVGFFFIADWYHGEPWLRAWLDGMGVAGYLALVLLIGVGCGLAAARWGRQAWDLAHDIWLVVR